MISLGVIDEIIQNGKRDQNRILDYFNLIYDLICYSYQSEKRVPDEQWIKIKSYFWQKLVDFDHQNLTELSITLPGYLEGK